MPRKPDISARKRPKQTRSADLVAAVLEAAVRVLVEEGATRFTTARVAERAGVSVGSLYQYFPNKASILFRLQSDEWRQTMELLNGILGDTSRKPLDRVRALVHAFVKSECEEAAVRIALNDTAPFYREAPQARTARESGDKAVAAFMEEALPKAGRKARALAADLIMTTLVEVGRSYSAQPRSSTEIAIFSDAMADMFVRTSKPAWRLTQKGSRKALANLFKHEPANSPTLTPPNGASKAPSEQAAYGELTGTQRQLRA